MVPAQRDPQLLKGVLPMLVLALLAERESYGYELVDRLSAAGLVDVATGTLYPVLSRLERDDLLASRLVSSPSGPARKYYRPTPSGLAHLAGADAAWRDLVAVVQHVMPTTPATGPGETQE